eukprot:scaffold25090_cov57-Phaeocystis_antarctica.AAC.5
MAPSRQRAAAAARRIANNARPQPCSPNATAAVARASTAACSACRRGDASSCGCGNRGDACGGGDDGGGDKRPWLGSHSVGSFFSALPLREREDEGRVARVEGALTCGCADEGRAVRCGLVRCGTPASCTRGAGCGAARGEAIAVHSSRGAGRVGGTSCTRSRAPSANFTALSYASSACSGCLAWASPPRARGCAPPRLARPRTPCAAAAAPPPAGAGSRARAHAHAAVRRAAGGGPRHDSAGALPPPA